MNILGHEYRIVMYENPEDSEMLKKMEAAAAVNINTKEIHISYNSFDNQPKTQEYLIRDIAHETVHAILYETGNQLWMDEEVVSLIEVFMANPYYNNLIDEGIDEVLGKEVVVDVG